MVKKSCYLTLALLLAVTLLIPFNRASAEEGQLKYDFDRIEVVYAAEFTAYPQNAPADHWLTALGGGPDKPIQTLYGIVHLYTGDQFIEEQFISVTGEGGSERFLSNSMRNEYYDASYTTKKQTTIEFWSGKKLDGNAVVKDLTQTVKGITLVQSFDPDGTLTGYQLRNSFTFDDPSSQNYYDSLYTSNPASLVHTGELNGVEIEPTPETSTDENPVAEEKGPDATIPEVTKPDGTTEQPGQPQSYKPRGKVSILSAAASTNQSNTIKADTLKQLGLFTGTNTGYQLDDSFTRAQGVAMLLRLSGEADDAAAAQLKPNFTDVKSTNWAANAIAYAVSKGYVKGIGNGAFAPDRAMSGKEFLTLINRLLGYPDATPSAAEELSRNNGLLTADAAARLASVMPFLRGDMVEVVYAALQTNLSGSAKTLIGSLVEDKETISADVAVASGLYTKIKSNEPLYYIPKPGSDPMDSIEQAIRQMLRQRKH
ncbi:S-layer homology domain-containing protein [Paenibacillus sp. PR3]|uniref:S-layer homology domain-containing protein n=1 Tax=Paenibacillus terricola TaxID=2763503 RepID=A0ABR8N4C3_9BACL|nr:S-layer homology domain-containing protein [Paenibacillus terricola]MBD3922065.1 S-layer homology domain-containing protein [Paenibacillus terricola]